MSGFCARAARLARLSLYASVLPCVAGCLDAPPEYSVPSRIPPVIDLNGIFPSVTSLTITDSPIQFTVPFRADDAGERLDIVFVRDVEIGPADPITGFTLPSDPRSFEEQQKPARLAKFLWNWDPTLVGCHTMTAIISDHNNFHDFYYTTESLEAARVTWFLWLTSPAAQQPEVPPVDCLQKKAAEAAP